jgi:hypothetical protein
VQTRRYQCSPGSPLGSMVRVARCPGRLAWPHGQRLARTFRIGLPTALRRVAPAATVVPAGAAKGSCQCRPLKRSYISFVKGTRCAPRSRWPDWRCA